MNAKKKIKHEMGVGTDNFGCVVREELPGGGDLWAETQNKNRKQ